MGVASPLIFDLKIWFTLNQGEKQIPNLATDNVTEIMHLEKLPASNVSQGMGSTPVFMVASFKGTHPVKGLEQVLP